MVRLSLAFCLVLSGGLTAALGPVAAQTADCPTKEGRDSCTRILACFGDEGVWFDGRSYGRGEGTLAGQTNEGTVCTGTWVSENAFGLGQADATCDDGFAVRVFFHYQEPYTGTTLGRGIGNDGRVVRSWSGLHVLDYLDDADGLGGAVLPCGEAPIPIS